MSEVKARANALLQDALGPSEERIRGTLRDVGFSSSAAEAFCALVRVREATAGDLVRKVEDDLGEASRRRGRVKLAIPDIQLERDLEKAAEVRSIVCNCLLIIVDAQQVLTMTRTLDGDAYAITSTDPTLVQLGLDYWASPRCCVM